MHPFVVLVYMLRDDQDKSFEYIASVTPPRGLFLRIMKRLGLEKELHLVKRHLGFFVTLFVIFLFLSIFAFIGVKQILAESSFGPFLSLIFSDPSAVIKYRHSFMFSVFESMPGVTATALLLSVAFLMLFIRFAASGIEKIFILIKSINKSRFASRQSRD